MTKEQFITKYGERKTKEAAGALHTFLAGSTMENHYALEDKIAEFSNLKIKESMDHLDPLLEFSVEE